MLFKIKLDDIMVKIKNSVFVVFLVLIFSVLFACKGSEKSEPYLLWQLNSETNLQMNSYVLKTPNNKIIVIDGGYKEDASYLKGFLAALGNNVDMWFITHAHSDHMCALAKILNSPSNLVISKVYGSLPTENWVAKVSGRESQDLKDFENFNQALGDSKVEYIDVQLGDKINMDKMEIEILGIKNPEIIEPNAINNSSLVFKMYLNNCSILFLADLGYEGGEKLLNSKYAARLPSDYVQMAHHGQGGVSEDFYKKVNPKYCLWPTPDWLWNNDQGKGIGTGPWQTLEVRDWMEKLNVKKNYVMTDGIQKIEIYSE